MTLCRISKPVPENSTHDGAMALAKRLTDYWAARGRTVVCEVAQVMGRTGEPAKLGGLGNVWGVTSNIIKSTEGSPWTTTSRASHPATVSRPSSKKR